MKFSMATIIARALTCAVTLPRVVSGLEVGDFPEAVQYLFAVQVPGGACLLAFLLDELLLHGGAVLEHVGVDTGAWLWCRRPIRG